MYANVLKFYIWIPHENIGDPYFFFFSSELSPILELLAHIHAHGELLWSVNVRCPSCAVRRAASTIALKAYSSYTPGPIDLILSRKHQGDL